MGVPGRHDLCAQANVRSYPTWTFQATRREGVLPLETLATPSDFMPPPGAR